MKHSFNYRRHGWKILLILLVISGGYLLWKAEGGQIDRDAIMRYGRSLPAGLFIAAFLILPLLGAPISIFLILTGIRFGFVWGMAVTAGCIIFHHLAAYQLSHGLFRQRLRNFIEKKGHKVPSTNDNAAIFTAGFAFVPGAPYAFKLYLLSLMDVSFGVYLFVGAPVYILMSMISVGAAAAVMHFNMWWIYAVLAVIALTVIIKRYISWKRGEKAAASAGEEPLPDGRA